MTERRYALARPFRLSLDSYARITGVHPDLVRRFIALGLLEMTLDVEQIKRAAATFPGRDGG